MKVTLTINGGTRQVVAGPDLVLLDLLRDELRNSLDQCGTGHGTILRGED